MNSISATISELRVLVSYLGEKGQANWWWGVTTAQRASE